ncbi:MAG: sigma-54-dependent Fis family transcriptional regulator [Deltaproteobacteria bacterium]|nr:sigma-54-dependent Fis family transcriptional regulator [Deltaproteobacteria bacterium]
MNQANILVIDDEENIRKILKAMLQAEGYEVTAAKSVAQAKEILRSQSIQVALTDLKLEREHGLQLLKWIRDENMPTPVIILTAHGTVDSAVDAMKQGAFDYLSKPFERSELVRVINKAVLTHRFQSHQFVQGVNPAQFSMIGQDEKMLKIFSLVDKVAATDSTVLISGESGTGKELVAQAIHERSSRSKAPFIKINCAAIPHTLMESELFGYERGAFTGAVNSKPGRFELADGGTLFLDEVGEMSTEMQVKVLRVLQDKCFERVGGVRTMKVDVRLITATNKDLELEVKEGRFRGDLYYRLNVVPVHLPPLRDRTGDIVSLIAHFVKKFSEQMKKTAPVINPESLELLTQFPWPGNIRQLENVIERLIVINESSVIMPDQLPEEILDYEEQRFFDSQQPGSSLKEMVKDATRRIEKKAIEDALSDTACNVTHAARKLNISRKGLQLKMKELGLR